jgi:G3E family GTPase
LSSIEMKAPPITAAPERARSAQTSSTETISIDAQAPAQPFPHFWERMFGSGRAILSLRESYRRDLRSVKQATGFDYIRFHAIFHDEVGVYNEDSQGRPEYNFSYVDQIYDGLLENGIRPFVELSFMPKQLAAKPLLQAFAWPEIRTRTTVDGVLAMVDAAALHSRTFAANRAGPGAAAHDNPVEEVFADQLAVADCVILNKADLVAPSDLSDLTTAIAARLRARVRLFVSRRGRVPPALALGLSAAAEDDLFSRPTQHELEGEHDHEDFESFVLTLGAVGDERAFLSRLSAVVERHAVLRIKGFVDEPGRLRRRVVEAVGPRLSSYFDRPWQEGEARATRLVVIGEKGLDRAAIKASLER